MTRESQLDELTASIVQRGARRIAIDGRCGSGKSTLARELAGRLRAGGLTVVCASFDDYHHPEERRYRQGRLSPEGYFADAFNYPAIRAFASQPRAGLLLFEGVFALRQELADLWDCTIFVQLDPETAISRCLDRDTGSLGTRDEVLVKYTIRYEPAWKIYETRDNPAAAANFVIPG